MAKGATYRTRKYKAKFDPTVVSARFSAVKDLAAEQTEAAQAGLANVEQSIRDILAAHALPTWQNVVYLNAGREMFKKASTFGGDTLKNEVLSIIEKYASKGLDRNILVEIAGLFGVSIPGYY